MLTSRVWRVVLVTGLAGALLAVMVSGAAMAASPAIGDWRMNEGSGTTLVDSSVSANNGTILGNPTWVTGQHGQAIRFDGTGDYATVPDNATLDSSSSITLATWVRPEKTGTQYLIKKATQGGTDGYELAGDDGLPVRPLQLDRERHYLQGGLTDCLSQQRHDLDASGRHLRRHHYSPVRERHRGGHQTRPGGDHDQQSRPRHRGARRRHLAAARRDGRCPPLQHRPLRHRDRSIGRSGAGEHAS